MQGFAYKKHYKCQEKLTVNYTHIFTKNDFNEWDTRYVFYFNRI